MNKRSHATTDVEFLGEPAIELRNQIIYLYQKSCGSLRFKVRDRVMKFAENLGCMTVIPQGTWAASFLRLRFSNSLTSRSRLLS